VCLWDPLLGIFNARAYARAYAAKLNQNVFRTYSFEQRYEDPSQQHHRLIYQMRWHQQLQPQLPSQHSQTTQHTQPTQSPRPSQPTQPTQPTQFPQPSPPTQPTQPPRPSQPSPSPLFQVQTEWQSCQTSQPQPHPSNHSQTKSFFQWTFFYVSLQIRKVEPADCGIQSQAKSSPRQEALYLADGLSRRDWGANFMDLRSTAHPIFVQ